MTQPLEHRTAQALLNIGAVGFSADEPTRFKSGILSPVYVDNRRLPYNPMQWRIIIDGFRLLIHDRQLTPQIIAGVAMGGVPHSATLGFLMRTPSVFIRKENKEHGKQQRIEGGDVDDKRVLLVEDLVTTGGSSISGVHALKDAGAHVSDIVAIVSYGFTEAERAFADVGVQLHTLTTFDSILEVARANGYFDDDNEIIIRDWFTDPHGWARRQGFE